MSRGVASFHEAAEDSKHAASADLAFHQPLREGMRAINYGPALVNDSSSGTPGSPNPTESNGSGMTIMLVHAGTELAEWLCREKSSASREQGRVAVLIRVRSLSFGALATVNLETTQFTQFFNHMQVGELNPVFGCILVLAIELSLPR